MAKVQQSSLKSLPLYSAKHKAASQQDMNPTEVADCLPRLVLDTNATLDWLVFGDPGMAALAVAIEGAELCWLVSPRMRDELSRTLNYPSLAQWKPDSERVLCHFDRWSRVCPEPVTPLASALICSDPDDQVFIDLALVEGARWLVTHDRALHKLTRQVAPRGLRIVRPKDWRWQ